MAATVGAPRAHFVMVANPPFHPAGDFALVDGTIREADTDRLTFGNIAVYDTALFRELPRGVKLKLLPLFRDWIARGWVSGERFDGLWDNVGTPSELAALDRRLAANRAAAF
jgi:MurNAc alpha-1-phosphate uridylyltransferase